MSYNSSSDFVVEFCWNPLCFIFEVFVQMARELLEILHEQIAKPANSCMSQNEASSVSFLDQIISPIYEALAAVSLNITLPHGDFLSLLEMIYYWSDHISIVSMFVALLLYCWLLECK